MRDIYKEDQYGYIFNLLKRTVSDTKQKDVAKHLNIEESTFSKYLKYKTGDVTIKVTKGIAEYFNIPLIQAITGENPHYKQITDTYGLKTSSLEWLKNKCNDREFDYIGILNIVLGNKEIAELLISTFYLYAKVEITSVGQRESLEFECTENIKKVLRLVANQNQAMLVGDISADEKKVELALKNLKPFSDKVDEELRLIDEEKRQEIEDFDKEAQEYYQELHKQ